MLNIKFFKQMDCPICRTDMNVVAYEENSTGNDIPLNETTVRLECGHAFHSTCIALSLRQGLSCPLCRSQPRDWNIILARPLEFEENTEIVQLSNDLIHEIESDTANLDDIRMHAPNVQYARKQFNKQKKKYNKYVQALVQERKDCLTEALTEFREHHKRCYDEEERKLQQKIRYVQNAEYKALYDKHGPEKAQQILQRYPYMYNIHSIMGQPEPMRRKFWRH